MTIYNLDAYQVLSWGWKQEWQVCLIVRSSNDECYMTVAFISLLAKLS